METLKLPSLSFRWQKWAGGLEQHIPRQESTLSYSSKHSEILHWLEYRENTKCCDPSPFTSKLGFWAYPTTVGLGHKLPRNTTASKQSSQVLQCAHVCRHSSSPKEVKGNCGNLLRIRAAVNLSKCHLHFDLSRRQV